MKSWNSSAWAAWPGSIRPVSYTHLLEGALAHLNQEWELLGPAPAAVAKVNNRYRYRLTLSTKNCRGVRELLGRLIAQAHQDRENRGISVYGDLNPY